MGGTGPRMLLAGLMAMLAVHLPSQSAHAGPAAIDQGYGCYKVIDTSAVNIRRYAYSGSPSLTAARKGEILVKWKRYCAWRGFWCPVQRGAIKGHADKSFLEPIPCPN